MPRTRYTGPMAGNYVTTRLMQRQTLGAAATSRDFMFGLPPFRISQICAIGYNHTGTLNFRIDAQGGTNNSGLLSNAVQVSGTPYVVTPGGFNTNAPYSGRDRDLGYVLLQPTFIANPTNWQAVWTTSGASSCPLGGYCVFLTGYMLDHVSRNAPFAVSGQSRTQGPLVGFYDNFPLINLKAVTASAAVEVCQIVAPYAGRVEAISIDARGMTTTTGTITIDVLKNGVSILSAALDLDANPSFIIDADSTPNLVADSGGTPPTVRPRTFAKGDTLRIDIGAGAADVVPINSVTANMLVWCQGHVRDENVEPLVED